MRCMNGESFATYPETNSGLSYAVAMRWTGAVHSLMMTANMIEPPDHFGSPLMIAARIGHFDYVKDLIGLGARVAEGGIHGTAVHAAAIRDHLDVIRYLRVHGASGHVFDDILGSPLQAASISGHLGVVDELLSWRSDFDVNQGRALRDCTPGGCIQWPSEYC